MRGRAGRAERALNYLAEREREAKRQAEEERRRREEAERRAAELERRLREQRGVAGRS